MKWFFSPPFLSVSPFLLSNLAQRQCYAYSIGLYTRPEIKSWPDVKFCAHAQCVLPRCWLRVHALLFPRPLSLSYEEQAVWDKQRSGILRLQTTTKSLELFSSTDTRLKIKRTNCIHSIENFFIEKGGWFFIGGPERVQRRQRAHRIEETAKSNFVLMNVTFIAKQGK